MASLDPSFQECPVLLDLHGNQSWVGIRVDLGDGQCAFIVAAGSSLGCFRETEIPEWVSTSDGKVYRFDGVCGDIQDASCRDGVLKLPPGLFMR
ncbi:MAG: hypothetical protein AB1899_08310 [Pseudomonadota bacterium]